MAIGIALSVMTQVGAFMEEFQFGIMEYLGDGEKIIETIYGEVIHGTTVLYIMVIFKETGGPGMTPIIGIDQKIVSLHTPMMEGCMKVDKQSLEQALKGVTIKVLQLKKLLFIKVPQLRKKRLEQVGMVLRVVKFIAQVKPQKVTILQQKKEKRNEVYVEEGEVNCPRRACDLKAMIQFKMTGKQQRHWFLTIEDGECTYQEGRAAFPTLTMKDGSHIGKW